MSSTRESRTRFSASGFFHESTPYGLWNRTLIYFLIRFRFRWEFRICNCFVGVWYPAEQKRKFKLGDSFNMDHLGLLKCIFCKQTILKKYLSGRGRRDLGVDIWPLILPQGALGGVGGHCELGGSRGVGLTSLIPNFATGRTRTDWL